jgi:ubiquitin C-terminal hydrolase
VRPSKFCHIGKDLPNFRQMFEGITKITTKCLECEVERSKKETFNQIEVSIPETNFDPSVPGSTWLINACRREEMLTDDNRYHCETCKTLTDAHRLEICCRFPDVLIFHLKTFTQDPSGCLKKTMTKLPLAFNLPCLPSCAVNRCLGSSPFDSKAIEPISSVTPSGTPSP